MIKVLLIFSAVFGIAAATLGFMTNTKVQEIKSDLANTRTQLTDTKDRLVKTETDLKSTKDTLATTTTELEQKKAEAVKLAADLNDANRKVEDLGTQLTTATKKADDLQLEITKLNDQLQAGFNKTPGVGSVDEIIAKMKETEAQLVAAQAESKMLGDQLAAATAVRDKLVQAEDNRQRKVMAKGLTGRVLAVNPAWNFVVINLGDRQGVVEGGEMVIRRGNEMIGRVRVSSVEPSTSIGDIIMSSVPRGLQVQPGDYVVFAGGQ